MSKFEQKLDNFLLNKTFIQILTHFFTTPNRRLEETDNDEDAYQEFYYAQHGSNAYGFIWGNYRSNYAQLQYYDEEKSEEIYADLGLVRKANKIRSNRRSQSAAAILSSKNINSIF